MAVSRASYEIRYVESVGVVRPERQKKTLETNKNHILLFYAENFRRPFVRKTSGRLVGLWEVTMSELRYPEWQTPYQEALLELDKKKLEAKIHLAEWKIFQRLQTISADSDHQGERLAIADALNALRVLKRDALNYPDWRPR